MQSAIRTNGLQRHFGQVRAVDGVDLDAPVGSVFGFLGPNGSGKTTTIRLLLGLIRPDAGDVHLNGIDLRLARSRALSGLGAIVETPALYPNLTGREVLRMATHLLKLDTSEIDRVLDIVGLNAAANRRVGTYSLGMRQRLAIGRALMGQPRLLILDEPTNGLDPAGIADIRNLIRSLPDKAGATVFVSSHQLSEMEQMTTHCALIKSGKLLFQGRLNALMGQAPARFVIDLEQAEAALQDVIQSGLDAYIEAGQLIIRATLSEGDRAALIRRLVENGHAISQARQIEPRLEDLFLSLTDDAEAG